MIPFELTQDIVLEFLTYDPATGLFVWKTRDKKWFKSAANCASWNTRFAGKPAFVSLNTKGYLIGSILGRHYLASRIAFLYMTGKMPDQVDHKNRKQKDNRWENLVSSNSTENSKNKGIYTSNTSTVPGVSFRPECNSWRSRINVSGKRISLGHYPTFDEAVVARHAAEVHYGYKSKTPSED